MNKKNFVPLLTVFVTLFSCYGRQNLQQWKNTYAITKMSQQGVSTLASALFYLIERGPYDTDSSSEVITQLSAVAKQFHLHPDCYNALIKAYEEATLASINKVGKEKAAAWRMQLLTYYQDLLNNTKPQDSFFTFGKAQGKKLPHIMLKEPDVDTKKESIQFAKVTTTQRKKPLWSYSVTITSGHTLL